MRRAAVGSEVEKSLERRLKEKPVATLAAGVFEVGDRRRDCGHSAPITSTHLLPYPATSCFGCMLCTQRPAASAPPPPPHAT